MKIVGVKYEAEKHGFTGNGEDVIKSATLTKFVVEADFFNSIEFSIPD